MSNSQNTGTQVPPGTGTAVPGSGTMVPPAGTGTAVPPGTGTAVPPSGTGTAVPPSGTGTAVPPGGAPQPRLGTTSMIPEYSEYIIKGIRYTVLPDETRKTLAKKSGEAKIFVVENGGRKFVIKLYIPGHSPNHAILDEVCKAKGGFLIGLHDHGRWTDPQHPGLTLDYEIMDYAPYGSLADVKLRGDEKRFRDVAWRMAFCIKQCHDHKILHRDVKPENFLFTDAARTQFVITDFGIARTLTGNGPVKVDTAKSSYFVSPEGSMSSKDRTTYVDRPTDYYSMGMTLLALWIGLDSFYALFPYDQLEELDRLKLNNKVISEIGYDMLGLSEYSRSLLERLLEAGDQNRADFNEIKRWYEGETLKTGSAAEAAVSKSAFNVTFDETKGKVAHSREELARLMLGDMEFAKSFIYRGMAKNALQASFPRLAAEIDDIPQRIYPRPEEQTTGVYAACLILDPTLPFFGRHGKKCTTPKAIADELCSDMVYYAGELKKKATPLWAFLKVRGGAAKDFPERFQPMIQRSGKHGVYALCKALNPSLGLENANGASVTTPAQLADMLWTCRSIMAEELANPDHTVWTWLASLGPNAAKLAAAYPAKIKNGGSAELYALCLALDSKMPYYGKNGKPCTNEKELAAEIWAHMGDYRKELSDPNHLLWQFMRTWSESWRKIADTHPALFAKKPDTYLHDLLYRLDPKEPYTVQDVKTQKWVGKDSFDEVIAYIRDKGVTDLTIECIGRQDFVTWLLLRDNEADRKRGALLAQLIKQAGDNAGKEGWYFLYCLAPEVGYYFKKGDCATVEQLGARINNEANGSPGEISRALSSPAMFRGSRLEQYMRARKMTSYINGILKIIDVQANVQAHKSAPYDSAVARWKVIEYLGAKATYTFWRAQTVVSSLADVRAVSQSDRNEETDKGLAAFLTLFFHERKGAQFSFAELKNYYDFLDIYCPSHSGLQKSHAARARVRAAVDGRDSAWRSLSRTRKIVTWVCMVPMVFMVAWMIYTSFTDGHEALADAFMGIGKVIAVGVAILGVLGGLAEGGLFGAIIGGLLGYWIPYWIFSFLSGLAPFVLAALVIAGGIWCVIKLNKQASDTYIPSRKAYDNLKNQADLYMVCEAFGTTGRTFGSQGIDPSSTFNKSRDLALSQRKNVRTAAMYMVLLTLITLVIGISLMKTVSKIEDGEYAVEAVPVTDASLLPGEWTGMFHGREAAVTLTEGTDGMYHATVTIQYSTPMVQECTVKEFSDGSMTMVVDDNPSAQYTGTVMDHTDFLEYAGTYTNTRKGTSHEFSFVKDKP